MQNYAGPDYLETINKCITKKALKKSGGEWSEELQQVLSKADIRLYKLHNSDQGARYNDVIEIENTDLATMSMQNGYQSR